MAEFALYSYFRSSASYRARIALHIKGIEFEYRAVHLLNDGGEQHKPEYRKLNPSEQVPTLFHQGKSIGQSIAILEYLEEVHPSPRLYPKDAYTKARVRQFCEIINCTQPLQNLATTQFLTDQMQLNESQKQAWMQNWLGNCFASLEALLKVHAGQYCFGDELTAADCFLVPQIFAANRFKIDLSRYPLICKRDQTLLSLPQFQKAHPLNQPDTPPQ